MTLTPPQQASLHEVRALIDRTSQTYGLRSIYVLVGNAVPGVGGTYRGGMLTISTPMLLSTSRDSLLAHELAHYVLATRHRCAAPRSSSRLGSRNCGSSTPTPRRWRFSRGPEGRRPARTTVVPRGHRPPCEEIADLLGRLPAHRSWTAALECAPAVLDANAAPR